VGWGSGKLRWKSSTGRSRVRYRSGQGKTKRGSLLRAWGTGMGDDFRHYGEEMDWSKITGPVQASQENLLLGMESICMEKGQKSYE